MSVFVWKAIIHLIIGWHINKQITGEEIENLFLSTYGVYKNGLVNSEGKVIKIGTDKEESYYFGAKHFFLKKVLELTLKEYNENKFYEYQALNLIGFQNGMLVGTIPQYYQLFIMRIVGT